MRESDRLPIYNLKAVVRETGLKPDTLRAWERRYGLPEPQRTNSGHRLYTEQDIQTLKWLVARQEEGLTISRAVALWHELIRQGDSPATHGVANGRAHASGVQSTAGTAVSHQAGALSGLMADWIGACLGFDERAAEQALQNAFALFPAETVLLRLIQPALAEIGVGWHEGRVTVQQEHFASALAMRRLEALLALTPAPTRRGRILVGCPPHEQHTFVPLMLSVLLRRRGWDVVYLGADVPLLSLEQTIEVARPTLVILTAQQLYTAASLLDMGNLLAEKRVPMAYGGLVFNSMPHLEQVIPGHFLGAQLDLAVDAIEAIMATPRVRAAARDVPPESEKVLRLFRDNRAQIEADIWQAFEHSGLSQMSMADANAAFGRSLESALALGMLEPYAVGIEWLADLLVMHYQLPASLISEYVRVYYQSVVRHMGAEGHILAVWLEDLAQSAETGNKPEIGAVRHRHSGVYTMRRG